MRFKKLEEQSRLVLDTNNLVSAHIVIQGPSARIFDLFKAGKIRIFTSSFQLKEFEKVLNYKRIKKKYRLTERAIKMIVGVFKKYAVIVYPYEIPLVIKEDLDDNQILAIALEAKAGHIISGDRHLLGLKKFKSIRIITAQEFLYSAGLKK